MAGGKCILALPFTLQIDITSKILFDLFVSRVLVTVTTEFTQL